MSLSLHSPVSEISRVGKVVASRLKKLDIETVSDLIFYYPWRWEDLSNVSLIKDLEPDSLATIKATVISLDTRNLYHRKKTLTESLVADDTEELKVIWFNQGFISKTLQEGDVVYLSGKMSFDKYGLKQMVSPAYEKARSETIHTARIVPVYPLTSNITQKQLRFLIREAINLVDGINDFLPPFIIKSNNFLDLPTALRQIHFPDNQENLEQAVNRLKFDELFLFQLQVMLSRRELSRSSAPALDFYEAETKKMISRLPFELTGDQKKAAWQIISDIQKTRPMNRLLEGDVGSGKTVVAALVMLNVLLNDCQSVLMSPTEILASQHYKTILELLRNHQDKICLLTRTRQFLGKKEISKKMLIKSIKEGKVKIIIGTHALIQQDVYFKNLSLAIIDEQHRFGVNQRKALRSSSGSGQLTPHLLSMTATPIPRSLALALYGDLDISIIREMPLERKKIITKVVDSQKRQKAYDFVKKEITAGRQVFVVCPLVDPSDKLGVKSVTSEFEKLNKEVFADFRVSMIHGRLKSSEKEKIMQDFSSGKTDVLVSTSVIEVGVDIPNATVMMIEDADRFGLAQLHQFRGRVGRFNYQSYCLIFSSSSNPKTKNRLKALETSKDGFELAEIDLKQRGPGSLYGQMQSGWPEFKIAKLSDSLLISRAGEAAGEILKKSPDLRDFPLVKQKMNSFLTSIHLE